MPKYDRLLFILNLLRSRKNMNAEALAEECGVTPRTIYRDIISLSEMNVPIYYDRGYKYATGNFLPALNFNLEEYLTINRVLESTPLKKDDRYRQMIKVIRSKIDSGLSPQVKEKKSISPQTAEVNIKSTLSDKFSSKIFADLENGINKNMLVEMNYNSIESGLKTRTVEPYFLIFIERAFYFVGYCHLRNDFRTFRIDRIEKLALTEKRFKPRRPMDPINYFENSWGVYNGRPIEVEAIFWGKAARVIELGRHHRNEKVIPLKDGYVNYKVKVAGEDEIFRWLISFAGEVKIIKPTTLAHRIKKAAKNLLADHK
ncbi:MAG: YafY family protein [Candidatus Zixiibacteriota bacterium]